MTSNSFGISSILSISTLLFVIAVEAQTCPSIMSGEKAQRVPDNSLAVLDWSWLYLRGFHSGLLPQMNHGTEEKRKSYATCLCSPMCFFPVILFIEWEPESRIVVESWWEKRFQSTFPDSWPGSCDRHNGWGTTGSGGPLWRRHETCLKFALVVLRKRQPQHAGATWYNVSQLDFQFNNPAVVGSWGTAFFSDAHSRGKIS